MEEVLLKTVNISKEFSGVRVLNNINIELNKEEIFGIIGENGAGKSTLIKIINGTYQPTEGQLIFDGQSVKMSHEVAKKIGISTIPQEFNLVEDLNVYENIFLGKEQMKTRFLLDKEYMKTRTQELLHELETKIPPDEKIQNLSVAKKQMVEIAKAIAYNSKLLIMDEPTTVLTSYEIEILFNLMKRLKEKGVTIVYISHKLKEVKTICDRVMVLRDGDFISLDKIEDIDGQEMANRMVGREFNQLFPEKTAINKKIVMEVKNLSIPGLLSDINFELYKGEILAFAGLVGAGRTELAETIMGIRKKKTGEIYINSKKRDINSPDKAINNKIAYLTEDRQGTGVLTEFDVVSNITLTSLKKYSKILIDHKKENEKCEYYIDNFNIKVPSLKSKLIYLSGGNQQKVSFAKSLDTEPDIFIVDEPTRGIDINAKMVIFRFIHELVQSGISCIFISSELEEIIGMCNRVVVMREGSITGILEGEHINEEEIMYYATGLKEGIS